MKGSPHSFLAFSVRAYVRNGENRDEDSKNRKSHRSIAQQPECSDQMDFTGCNIAFTRATIASIANK